jgi:uncharacterized protein YqgC (DUF456 family)
MELLSLLLPILIDLFNRHIKNSDLRFWVSVVVCAVVGICLNYVDTMWGFQSVKDGFESITSSIMVTFGLAQLAFKGYYENSTLREKITGRISD